MASPKLLSIIGLVLTNLFWTGNIYVAKIMAGNMPPITLNTYRWVIAVIVLTPFALRPTIKNFVLIRQNFGGLLVFAFLGVTVYNAFVYAAGNTTTGINMAVIATLTPVATLLFAWVILGAAPRKLQIVGLALGVFGVLLLIAKGQLDRLLFLQFSLGDMYMLMAVFCWAFYTVLKVRENRAVPAVVFLYATMVLGTLLSVPLMVWEMSQQHSIVVNQQTVLAILYIGVFPSVLSYLFYNHAVRHLSANAAALSTYLLPVFTSVISVVWLGEQLQWFHIVGQFFVFSGFIVTLMGGKTAPLAT